MGIPRRGCLTCRKRRVKCDIVQPVCGRCTKASRDCVWEDSNHQGLLFKDENSFAGGRPRRPKESKTQPTTAPTAVTEPNIDTAIDVFAFGYFVRNFLFQPDDLPDFALEYSAFVLQQWSQSSPSSSLHLAFHAAAFSVFGREKKLQKAMDQAASFHAESVAKMQEEMQEQTSETINAFLITELLLGFYRNTIVGMSLSEKARPFPSYYNESECSCTETICVHTQAVLLLGSHVRPETQRNLALERAVRRSIIRACIFYGNEVPDCLSDGSVFGETGPILQLDSVMVEVSRLHALATNLLSKSDSAQLLRDRIKELAAKAGNLDHALATWSNTPPQHWETSALSSNERPESQRLVAYGPESKNGCENIAIAAILNRCRALRIMLNSIRLRCLSRLQDTSPPSSTHDPRIQACQQTIQLMTQESHASLPTFFEFRLPNRRGFEETTPEKRLIMSASKIAPKMAAYLAWPMAIVVKTESISSSQRIVMEEELYTVADALQDAALKSMIGQSGFLF
ncbi:hypothetical protein PV04_03003 [Phialophora macrospora]|uniref:Zn(2)-C6 fungal-type domain-containing protein n=1 Tax=Phialophora macrospora TaxID=1851006 RepID=A0A0D2E8W8_9EURO|nr:hypothetical protein PV04_03003 [Phialophora macrospora]